MAMGKFEIQTIPNRIVPLIRKIDVWIAGYGERLGPPCCGKIGCVTCRPCPLHEIKKFMKSFWELGILVESELDPVIVPEEITIEIISREKKSLFSIDLKCDVRDRKVGLKSKGRRFAYLITPDKDAVTALDKHFRKGHWINVIFKVKEPKGASDMVYLVNRTSLGR
jgi:hypothetical protein